MWLEQIEAEARVVGGKWEWEGVVPTLKGRGFQTSDALESPGRLFTM